VDEIGVLRREGELVVVEAGWRADGGRCPAAGRLRELLGREGGAS
jgi:pilus assembly protein CpaF